MQDERASIAQIQERLFVCVGDLVKWRPDLPFTYNSEFGIVVEIIDEVLVGVLWSGSEHVYMEDVNNLEVMNEDR